VRRQWADRKKLVFEPLFTSYVFINAIEQDLIPIKQTDGVLNFVYWLGRPAVIRNEEIDIIKSFLNDHSNVTLEKIQVNINDRVRINSGPLMLLEGDVLEVKRNSVKVFLPTLGYAMVADIRSSEIELVNHVHASAAVNKQISA
jgi:transcription antitermination factor NusG